MWNEEESKEGALWWPGREMPQGDVTEVVGFKCPLGGFLDLNLLTVGLAI